VATLFAFAFAFCFIAFGGAAALCAKFGSYRTYVFYVSAVMLACIVLAEASSPTRSTRDALSYILSIVPLGAVYLFALGTMVRRAAAPSDIIAVSLLLSIVAVPVWFVWTLQLACIIGHQCL
jgi:hypothetical protein